MNKHLKTLLLVSTIILPLSACSGHMHGKHEHGKNCKVTRNMEVAKNRADALLKDLDAAVANTSDAATKKRLQKIVKDADRLSHEISKCTKMCDAKGEKSAAVKPAAKSAQKAAVKPIAAAKPAAQPNPLTAK